MYLAAGAKLGPYEILAPIGAGGMGEVYRARDRKLKRDVALKVLPAAFANDPDRMGRFQREAEVLASLNHPNIAHLYGIEDRALVMELVEGGNLKGPLTLETALDYAKQIADALEYAHERGVIHRDLKPANVMVTPDGVVKVLDFGLAKAIDDPSADPSHNDLSNSPTLTLGATRVGMIMGTAAYMSPEQATGKDTDRRADIWAFGALLYEMLTGRQLFIGESSGEVLASVIKEQPDLSRTPPQVRRLLKSCLEKNRKNRLQAIGDWRLALGEVEQVSALPPQARGLRRWIEWAVAAVLLLALAAVSFLYFREPHPVETSLRLSVPLPDKFAVGYFALSPDGRTLAIAGVSENKRQLWLRDLDSLEFRILSNTDGARDPFWSPDGRTLGFFADGKLKIVPVTGGPPTPLCDAGFGGGGAWNRDGVILFGAGTGPIQRVNAAGGACTPVTQAEPDVRHRLPSFLSDGKHFLYFVQSTEQSKAGLSVAALEQPVGRKLLLDQSSAIFVPRKKGLAHDHLLFQRENQLMAQPFDAETSLLEGNPFVVAAPISRTFTTGEVAASASNGTLVYLAGSSLEFQAIWLDRTGKELAKVGPLGKQQALALAPDQKTVALGFTGITSRLGIWLRELNRDVETRFTLPPFVNSPVWSPDSSRIAFSSPEGGLYVKNASGGAEQLLIQRGHPISPSDWSRDGKYLLYTDIDPVARGDIWVLPFDPSGKPGEPIAFHKTEFNESQGQFSPDGHWVAYVSDVSGESAIYVRQFPSGGGPIRISIAGSSAIEPRWRSDGKELYYLISRIPYSLMMVSVQSRPGGPLEIGVPKSLFELQTRTVVPEGNSFSYSPSADGRRFLMNILPDAAPPTLNVITNWEKEAK